MRSTRVMTAALAIVAVALTVAPAMGAGLSKGSPDWKSAGPIAFGPDGLLFLADTQGAALFAVDTGDRKPDTSGNGNGGALMVGAINEKLAALLGTSPKDLMINDLAVNPASGRAYLSVSRGKGPGASPALVRVDRSGRLELVPLDDVPFAKAPLPNPPAPNAKKNARGMSITDMAFVDGRVFVAGLSNEEFSSRLMSIPYPFSDEAASGTGIRIYHGAHGQFETASPVRTFVPFDIKGEHYLLAAYTCTPLVKLPVSELKPGAKVTGTTVAELGNRNTPLDMIVYKKDGKTYLLLANNSRGVMKIQTEGVDKAEPITEHVPGGGRKGQPYDTIDSLKGVTQLDSLDKDHALVLIQEPDGAQDLKTIDLP
jgi:hypothetical protein